RVSRRCGKASSNSPPVKRVSPRWRKPWISSPPVKTRRRAGSSSYRTPTRKSLRKSQRLHRCPRSAPPSRASPYRRRRPREHQYRHGYRLTHKQCRPSFKACNSAAHTTKPASPWLTNMSVLNFSTAFYLTILNFGTVGGGYLIYWSVY